VVPEPSWASGWRGASSRAHRSARASYLSRASAKRALRPTTSSETSSSYPVPGSLRSWSTPDGRSRWTSAAVHIVTTDAPYRELISKIEAYGRQGVLGVDMETSAMYALGQVRYVDVCNLLVVSDELSHEWRPAFGQTELLQALQRAQRVVLRCLTKLSATAAGNDRSA